MRGLDTFDPIGPEGVVPGRQPLKRNLKFPCKRNGSIFALRKALLHQYRVLDLATGADRAIERVSRKPGRPVVLQEQLERQDSLTRVQIAMA